MHFFSIELLAKESKGCKLRLLKTESSRVTGLTPPATIQCFLATNLATLTGTSQASKVFTVVCTHRVKKFKK